MSAVTAALPETEPPIIDDPLELGRFTRWIVGTQGERLGESSLQIGGKPVRLLIRARVAAANVWHAWRTCSQPFSA